MTETLQPREDRTEIDRIAVVRPADGTEVPGAFEDMASAGMKVALTAAPHARIGSRGRCRTNL